MFEHVSDEPITFFSGDFWGQLLPLAIVLAFVAATVTMSAPQPTEPPAESPAVEELDVAQALSHDQFDSQATPKLTEILAQMPDEPTE